MIRTKETLEAGNFLSVINILMQLRKVSIQVRNESLYRSLINCISCIFLGVIIIEVIYIITIEGTKDHQRKDSFAGNMNVVSKFIFSGQNVCRYYFTR